MSPGNGEHPPRDPRQFDGLDTYPVAQVDALVERIATLEAENKAMRDRFSDADTERNVAQAALKAAFARVAELEADSKRLDWLLRRGVAWRGCYNEWWSEGEWLYEKGKPRDIIDEAMEAKP